VRDLDTPSHKVEVQVATPDISITAIADRYSPLLQTIGVNDGRHAFYVEFSRILTDDERETVEVRAQGGVSNLEHAPALSTSYMPWGVDPTRFQGYLDERSTHHVAGWARNLDDATDKIALEIWLDGQILARIAADQFSKTLVEIGVGDGTHAFHHTFAPPITPHQRDRLEMRFEASAQKLQHAPELRSSYEPIAHLAMDIVNNCNLRCPFCVVDYAGTKSTKLMSDAVFQSALRLIPFVTDGNFWLSCLHEATLHPKLLEFIASVPREYRRKIYYTTNLAKRMPNSYFQALCEAGLHHINISLESLDPAIYEAMRAGARFPIFLENWNSLLAHHESGSAPPRLRYNIMCYRSNLRAIPNLVQTLLDDKRAWQVELRHTYDVFHIPDEFRVAEFLTTEEWAWLAAELAHHDPTRVVLLLPPGGQGHDPDALRPKPDPDNDDGKFIGFAAAEDAAWNRAPRPYNLAMDWSGVLRVYGWKPQGGGQPDRFITYAKTNITFLADPLNFLSAL
jgi:hypothetical protein